jgi:hypothetical protein
MTGSGEEIAKLMERAGHHPIGGVESLLDAIAMMNVDIDIQNSRVKPVTWRDGEGTKRETLRSGLVEGSKTDRKLGGKKPRNVYLSSSRIAKTISFT